jgi:TDG/mug DNA glycosylase family protein
MTLPDLLQQGLAIVFVGANPSIFSAERGHYYARPTNRFWPALSRSRLSADARRCLEVDRLRPEHDAALLRFGVGFTDVVKRASISADELAPLDWEEGARSLARRLRRFQPQVACFQTREGFSAFMRGVVGTRRRIELGLQPESMGTTRLFLVPSPSGRNAHTSVAIQAEWYDRLKEHLIQPRA